MEMLPINLVKSRGAIIDIHKPITRNDAAVVDGSTMKHSVNIRTTICSIFHISRDVRDIDKRSK
jgi:hypothetical protein